MQSLATTVAYETIANEYRAPLQAARIGLGIIDICMGTSASPADFQHLLVRQLQRKLPTSAPRSVRAEASPQMPAAEFAKHARAVSDAVFAAAHASPVLIPVEIEDRSGRTCTEFYGAKKSWMSTYSDPPRLMKSIDGAPVRLPIIP